MVIIPTIIIMIPATGEQGMNMVPFSLTEDMEPIKSKDSSKYIIYKEYDVLGTFYLWTV
jgi:hypothetical protein